MKKMESKSIKNHLKLNQKNKKKIRWKHKIKGKSKKAPTARKFEKMRWHAAIGEGVWFFHEHARTDFVFNLHLISATSWTCVFSMNQAWIHLPNTSSFMSLCIWVIDWLGTKRICSRTRRTLVLQSRIKWVIRNINSR